MQAHLSYFAAWLSYMLRVGKSTTLLTAPLLAWTGVVLMQCRESLTGGIAMGVLTLVPLVYAYAHAVPMVLDDYSH